MTGSSLLAFASVPVVFVSMALIAVPMVRRGGLRGRALLVGGALYAIYVGLVLLVITGALHLG